MKSLIFLLLIANAVVGVWLVLGGPLDVVREPGRMELQVDAGRFRLLTDADLARMRSQAERVAAAGAPAPAPKSDAAPVELPSAACVEIGNFPSEGAAKKARTRLAAIGLAERSSLSTVEHATRLRVSGVDAAAEVRIKEILKDFPKQRLQHCAETAAAR